MISVSMKLHNKKIKKFKKLSNSKNPLLMRRLPDVRKQLKKQNHSFPLLQKLQLLLQPKVLSTNTVMTMINSHLLNPKVSVEPKLQLKTSKKSNNKKGNPERRNPFPHQKLLLSKLRNQLPLKPKLIIPILT